MVQFQKMWLLLSPCDSVLLMMRMSNCSSYCLDQSHPLFTG